MSSEYSGLARCEIVTLPDMKGLQLTLPKDESSTPRAA